MVYVRAEFLDECVIMQRSAVCCRATSQTRALLPHPETS